MMRFQNEASVFKFILRDVDGALNKLFFVGNVPVYRP